MTAVTIPQSRPPREHVSARLWWLATAQPAENASGGGSCVKHNYMPTRDGRGRRIYQCTRCGHSYYP